MYEYILTGLRIRLQSICWGAHISQGHTDSVCQGFIILNAHENDLQTKMIRIYRFM